MSNGKMFDVVKDRDGVISVITETGAFNKNALNGNYVFDRGKSLAAVIDGKLQIHYGYPVNLTERYRVIAPLSELLTVLQQRFDFTAAIEPELSPMEKLQKQNELLLQRLETVEKVQAKS